MECLLGRLIVPCCAKRKGKLTLAKKRGRIVGGKERNEAMMLSFLRVTATPTINAFKEKAQNATSKQLIEGGNGEDILRFDPPFLSFRLGHADGCVKTGSYDR